jgi:diacylglycerol kinase (ATP)
MPYKNKINHYGTHNGPIFIRILVTIAGFYFNISATEWLFQTLAIGFVMSIEGLNTAVEK